MPAEPESRPALPPMKFLDSDQFKREEAEYHNRYSAMSAKSVASSTAASPTFPHPAGPPPPYSNLPPLPSANVHPTSTSHFSDTRSQSGDEKEILKPQTRQSLPSLQEALGVEQSVSHLSESATYPTAPHPAALAPVTSSPLPPSRTAHAMDPPSGPHNPYMHPTTHTSYQSLPRAPVSHHPAEAVERRLSDEREHANYHARPAQSDSVARSPITGSGYRAPPRTYPHPEPSVYESMPPASAPPAQRSFAYGYAPYGPPPQFAPPPAPPSSLAPQIYQPSVTQPPPGQHPASWRAEGSTAGPVDAARSNVAPSRPYGESVKRHLDMYDFEAALNELADNSAVALNFSRQYGNNLHATQRSGPLPGTLPALTEIDDLVNRSKNTLDALNKMREVLVAQQAVYYQQAQEERFKSEAESKRNDSVHHSEQAKDASFAGDSKKRRGVS